MIADKEGSLVEIRVAKEVVEEELPTFAKKGSRTLHIHESESPTSLELEERLRAVEGAFSILGLKKIDFTRLSRHWYCGRDILNVDETIFQYDTNHEKGRNSNTIIPQLLTQELLRRSLQPKLDHFGLSFTLFKQGMQEISDFQYVKSIWFFSFFVEHAFANGKFQKKQQSKEYVQSGDFANALSHAKKLIEVEIKKGDISREKAEELLINRTLHDFSKWVTDRRGFYLHQSNKRKASGKSNARWHPSNLLEVKDDAVCLATFSRAAAAIMFETYCGSHQFNNLD